jgi:hypothetical protein
MEIAEARAGSRANGSGRNRDRELVCFIGRHGAVAIEHVMASMGVGRTAAYRRVSVCVEAGLLERLDLVRGEPSLLRATRDGLRYAGLGLPLALVSPGAVEHHLRCATTALWLGERHGHDQILTERELVLAERIEGKPIASAKVGELPGGAPRLHRPDLVIFPPAQTDPDRIFTSLPENSLWDRQGPSRSRTQGEVFGGAKGEPEDAEMRRGPAGPIAVEVELTPKSPRRLEELIRAWRGAHLWVSDVRYYCRPGQTRRAVERAIDNVRAGQFVHVFEVLPRTPKLSEREATG